MSKKKNEQSGESPDERLKEIIENTNWCEDQAYSEDAMKVIKAMKGMTDAERTKVMFEIFAHESEMSYIIIGRYLFELMDGLKECYPDLKEKELMRLFGERSKRWGCDVMLRYFGDEVE